MVDLVNDRKGASFWDSIGNLGLNLGMDAVSLLPVPAITGTLFAVLSTANLIHSLCSSSVKVEPSPVVPQMTRASIPPFI